MNGIFIFTAHFISNYYIFFSGRERLFVTCKSYFTLKQSFFIHCTTFTHNEVVFFGHK